MVIIWCLGKLEDFGHIGGGARSSRGESRSVLGNDVRISRLCGRWRGVIGDLGEYEEVRRRLFSKRSYEIFLARLSRVGGRRVGIR